MCLRPLGIITKLKLVMAHLLVTGLLKCIDQIFRISISKFVKKSLKSLHY